MNKKHICIYIHVRVSRNATRFRLQLKLRVCFLSMTINSLVEDNSMDER